MKKVICLLLGACMLFALTGCGGKTTAPETVESAKNEEDIPKEQQSTVSPDESADHAAVVEEDLGGQNPVMNFVGNYGAYRANILVEADGAENAKFTVTWASSAWEKTEWVMSGRFDPDTLTVEYDNGTLTELTFNGDGEIDTSSVTYEDGAGSFIFNAEDDTLTWEDNKAHVADGLVFEYTLAPETVEIGDPEYYSAVTAMDKRAVEDVCFSVRDAYLSGNWYAIAGMIRYPITINETQLQNEDEFLEYMKDKTIHESDRAVMLEENCHDMFINGEGICMGSGQVWLNDPGYMTDELPMLEIIALSGIVAR